MATNSERLTYLMTQQARLEEGQRRIEQKLVEFINRHDKIEDKLDKKIESIEDELDEKVSREGLKKGVKYFLGILVAIASIVVCVVTLI